VSKRKRLIFKSQIGELTWLLIGFSIPGSIIGALWVFVVYSDVEQGALAVYFLGPLGAAIGELLALGIWLKKKTKSNPIIQRTGK